MRVGVSEDFICWQVWLAALCVGLVAIGDEWVFGIVIFNVIWYAFLVIWPRIKKESEKKRDSCRCVAGKR